MKIENGGLLLGRRIEFFTSVSGIECGYVKPQCDPFAVHYPKNFDPEKKYPLYVIFHSAGHDVYSTLSCMMYEGNHDIYHTPDDMFGLILDCRTNQSGDWWWGGINALGEGDRARESLVQPVERRCIETITRVIESYPIDTDRVYAVGNSMGGSGALGVALCRGDIFAAIKVNVPAGVRHAADRCYLDKPMPEGLDLPDPPVVVDYSAQDDVWSTGHEIIYKGMRDKRYAICGYWGKFGHANNHEAIAEHNDLIHAFPVFEIKKSEAYPVFTNASCDHMNPWEYPDTADISGQVNGFFRFENIKDSEKEFKMALWLLSPDEFKTRFHMPEEATADLLLRRVQSFKLTAGERFKWILSKDGNEITSGVGCATYNGHPSVDNITVTREKCVLTLIKI